MTIAGTATDTGGRVGAVEVSTDNGTTWHPATGRESWTYSWTTPASGSVTVKARAADDNGNLQSTPTSVTVTIGITPATPTGLSATTTAGSIALDWADGESDVVGYNVYRSTDATGPFTKQTGSPVAASAWTDPTPPAGTYHYKVTALNADGLESAPSATANATIVAPPPATPTGLSATTTAGSIALDWADGESDVVGYNVYRSTDATGPFTKQTGSPVAASAWTDPTPPAGTYHYKVTALNADGLESAPSATANATIVAPPTPPPTTPTPDPTATTSPPPTTTTTTTPTPVVPAPVSCSIKATAGKSKIRVNMGPNLPGKGYYRFQVQAKKKGVWVRYRTPYATQGKGETRTVNVPKGIYRVACSGTPFRVTGGKVRSDATSKMVAIKR